MAFVESVKSQFLTVLSVNCIFAYFSERTHFCTQNKVFRREVYELEHIFTGGKHCRSTAGVKQVNKSADESVCSPTKEKLWIKGIGVQIISCREISKQSYG